jgi:hypothetical protein
MRTYEITRHPDFPEPVAADLAMGKAWGAEIRLRAGQTTREGPESLAASEDLGWLYPGQAARDVAVRWLASGPSLVAVTLSTSPHVSPR